MPEKGKGKRGFASMDEEKQRQIASLGGKAAHAKGTAHEFTPEEARNAGRKGGQAVSRDRTHMASIGRKGGETVSEDRAHMAEIGSKGGQSRSQKKTEQPPSSDVRDGSELRRG
ncbi:MAG: KGG domain-containing protein [Candidatus Xenobia bacterium]